MGSVWKYMCAHVSWRQWCEVREQHWFIYGSWMYLPHTPDISWSVSMNVEPKGLQNDWRMDGDGYWWNEALGSVRMIIVVFKDVQPCTARAGQWATVTALCRGTVYLQHLVLAGCTVVVLMISALVLYSSPLYSKLLPLQPETLLWLRDVNITTWLITLVSKRLHCYGELVTVLSATTWFCPRVYGDPLW